MSDCPKGKALTQNTHPSIFSGRERGPEKIYDNVHDGQGFLESTDSRKIGMRRGAFNCYSIASITVGHPVNAK